ncbi:MAG: rRNA maturation RNase YbeY [Candidatus Hydrogenedentota bacterium]|nr:MAG: rRNA maturation RNase YbeY [Candidatus Hydrogenedentota bacterium]
MPTRLRVRNDSSRKHVYRSDVLTRLADRICEGEGISGEVEISVLFCDDPFMKQLNQQYRNKNTTTDVLSFEQENMTVDGTRVLGDIVVSLETVDRNCDSKQEQMRGEVRMLLCHGLLHLLGYDHGTVSEKEQMVAKQAKYLDISKQAAWSFGPKKTRAIGTRYGGV